MPPGQGGSTSGNVDRATVTTRRRRCYRRSTEKMSPANAEFERQVAAVAAKQEEERTRQMYGHILFYIYYSFS
ncbi:hypothetical protein GQ55_9G426700 [Panicum hallii var. hallii]|uniref:Uncharacterized protein n=1 Tax=Panicum hallii var. hallii TaxID=1504633 RepID=A0A2T7CB47_9POAL|nr:hypothetical protein GQ55_9G426700 [Panicum hallii var. hallii]